MTGAIDKSWPTEDQDLITAANIINKHIHDNGGEPLEMIKVIVDRSQEQPVDIHMSEWVIEMIGYFREKYGYEHGHAVISNILTRLYLQHETLH